MPTQVSAAPFLDGAVLSWPWSLPFIGVLLSIATGPLFFPRVWARHYGKITAGWSALTLVAIGRTFGAATAIDAFLHAMLLDYMSFIALLFSLYVVAGGILVTGNLRGTPTGNAGMATGGWLPYDEARLYASTVTDPGRARLGSRSRTRRRLDAAIPG